MLSKFMNSNTASTSGSGTLPGNTITNLKEDLQGITTRSGVAYQGPTIPTTSSSPLKVVERETEVTKDTVPPTNNGSTKDVQPPVVQAQPQVPNYEPVVVTPPKSGSSGMVTMGCYVLVQQSRYKKRPQKRRLNKVSFDAL
ncbi:hypothetical protein Tco_0037973 [Tanacetum coccineum]